MPDQQTDRRRMIFALRTRDSDDQLWGLWTSYPSRSERDQAARFARIIGGMRTHSANFDAVEWAVRLEAVASPPKGER